MGHYRIAERNVEADSPEFAAALEAAYARKERPRCMCNAGGVEMYVAKIAGRHFIKRMPNTGAVHSPGCESYEAPPELSGLGQVMGTAIEENVDDGYTALKLGFSLSKGGTRAAPTGASVESDSVKTDGNKLTLRGLLHYLWEQAQFNRWSPQMEGKRSWYTIRKFLLQHAQNMRAKGQELGDILFIPESFRADDKDAINERRRAHFARIAGAHKSGRRLNVVVGEVKEIGPSRYGYKVVLKHLPDMAFMLNEDMHKRLLKRFQVEMGLWDAAQDVHLVLIGTFGVNATGVASLEESALIACNSQWIPIESMYDKQLVDHLIEKGRRFAKGLRYNLPSNRPLASAVLSDAEPVTALYVVPPGAEDDYMGAVAELIAGSQMASWSWRAGETQMPDLPAPAPAPYRPSYIQQQVPTRTSVPDSGASREKMS